MSTREPAPRRAIALEYDGDSAPRVSALGHNEVAEQIIAIAREHGVPLMENPELAGLLAQLDLGDQIPETLYLCVAQIIAFAYHLRGRVPAGWREGGDDEESSWID
jgi:flagellar biosynthesis protein